MSKHRASGQGVVRLSGRDFYLGKFGTKAAKQKYDALTGEWLKAGRQIPTEEEPLCVNHQFWP
jgi:hypothetical protein